MATVNMRGKFKDKPLDRAYYSSTQAIRKRVDFADLEADGNFGDTFQLCDIPANAVIRGGFAVVTTEIAASGGSGTLQFKLNSVTLTDLISTTSAIAVNTVFSFSPQEVYVVVAETPDANVLAPALSGRLLYTTAADTLDLVTATALPDTGVMEVVIEYTLLPT